MAGDYATAGFGNSGTKKPKNYRVSKYTSPKVVGTGIDMLKSTKLYLNNIGPKVSKKKTVPRRSFQPLTHFYFHSISRVSSPNSFSPKWLPNERLQKWTEPAAAAALRNCLPKSPSWCSPLIILLGNCETWNQRLSKVIFSSVHIVIN